MSTQLPPEIQEDLRSGTEEITAQAMRLVLLNAQPGEVLSRAIEEAVMLGFKAGHDHGHICASSKEEQISEQDENDRPGMYL